MHARAPWTFPFKLSRSTSFGPARMDKWVDACQSSQLRGYGGGGGLASFHNELFNSGKMLRQYVGTLRLMF